MVPGAIQMTCPWPSGWPSMRTVGRTRRETRSSALLFRAGNRGRSRPVGDDQGVAPVDAEDHPGSDRLAAQDGQAGAIRSMSTLARMARWSGGGDPRSTPCRAAARIRGGRR